MQQPLISAVTDHGVLAFGPEAVGPAGPEIAGVQTFAGIGPMRGRLVDENGRDVLTRVPREQLAVAQRQVDAYFAGQKQAAAAPAAPAAAAPAAPAADTYTPANGNASAGTYAATAAAAKNPRVKPHQNAVPAGGPSTWTQAQIRSDDAVRHPVAHAICRSRSCPRPRSATSRSSRPAGSRPRRWATSATRRSPGCRRSRRAG